MRDSCNGSVGAYGARAHSQSTTWPLVAIVNGASSKSVTVCVGIATYVYAAMFTPEISGSNLG